MMNSIHSRFLFLLGAILLANLLVLPARAQGPAGSPPLPSASWVTSDTLMTTCRQIVIEGLVVEVDSATARRWGINWLYARNDATNPNNNFGGVALREGNTFPNAMVPTLSSSSGLPVLGTQSRATGIGASFDGFKTDTGAFRAEVRAAVGLGKANILSQPIAACMTGTLVNLATIDEIPFQDVKTGDNTQQALDLANKKVGISLEVIPTLRPSSQRVFLDVKSLSVGQLTGFVTLNGVSRPVIQTSQVNTQLELADHESLLISGIKSSREQKERRGIPLMKDIPYLGPLFGSQTVINEQVDVLFMITPHLLKPGENPTLPRDFKNRSIVKQ